MGSLHLTWAPVNSDSYMLYRAPERKSSTAAAFDIYLPQDVSLQADMVNDVDLNIACAMPPTWRAKLEMRSSLALDYGMSILGGVIDSDYVLNWRALIWVPAKQLEYRHYAWADERVAHKDDEFSMSFKKGERICQAIFTEIPACDVVSSASWEDVKREVSAYKSSRQGGFGTTGS